MPGLEVDLLAIDRGSVTAPAGCGKTHLIAEALVRHRSAKPVLVLTHTNAGVAALRGRLDRLRVARSRYRLATIDGFAMRLIATFPMRSGHDPAILKLQNSATDYPVIQSAALGLLGANHLHDVLPATYARLLVDEYQDCSTLQHNIVLAAAEAMPTCVLGDPLQAIFDFRREPLVDWNGDVRAEFPEATQLDTPWRWINAGEEAFGRWLLEARQALLNGRGIDLAAAPANVRHSPLNGGKDDHKRRLLACRTAAPSADGCVLILADSRRPQDQRAYASQTPGAVTAENVDMRDLVEFARNFAIGSAGALRAIVDFAAATMTNVGPDDFVARVATLRAGRERRQASDAERAALEFEDKRDYASVGSLLAAISATGGVREHRPAILRGCHRMLELCQAQSGLAAYDASVQVRERARLIGRPLARRTVGSTLLLKGLEAEVSVILHPENMNAQHLYVAMTRGSKLMVVCSNSSVLNG